MSYQERYTAYQEAIETYLNTIFSAEDKPYGKLQESIRYSLLPAPWNWCIIIL